MAFEKGHAKKGGRVAGTPNKRTQALTELKEKTRLDPLDFFRAVLEADLSTLKGDAPTLDQRLTAAKELASYLYPKRKAIEVSGEGAEVSIQLRWPEESATPEPDPQP